MYSHIFVLPNFSIPPPPPPTQQDIFTERFNNFLELRSIAQTKIQQNKNKVECHISEATNEFRDCYDVINKIKLNINNLNEHKSRMSEIEWNEKILIANKELQKVFQIISKYSQNEIQENLQQKLLRRKEKRCRIHKRKEQTLQIKKFYEQQRKLKHKQIDQWLHEQNQTIADKKRQKENENRIDEILINVRNRRKDAEKTIKTLELMKKLHHIKRRLKHFDENYERKIIDELNEIKTQWQSFLCIYEKEENDIRQFLQKDTVCDAWKEALFVAGADKMNDEKMEKITLKEFIEIRMKWDKFLVSNENPFGSTIPIGLIIPPHNPSAKWQQFIKTSD